VAGAECLFIHETHKRPNQPLSAMPIIDNDYYNPACTTPSHT